MCSHERKAHRLMKNHGSFFYCMDMLLIWRLQTTNECNIWICFVSSTVRCISFGVLLSHFVFQSSNVYINLEPNKKQQKKGPNRHQNLNLWSNIVRIMAWSWVSVITAADDQAKVYKTGDVGDLCGSPSKEYTPKLQSMCQYHAREIYDDVSLTCMVK